ncbi:MAG TPA: glycosyltransferase [Bdellovibrionota bacterium]|nr:glycosyltransferase [Bdellovibrionota bacterium]
MTPLQLGRIQSVRIYSPSFPYPVREGAFQVAFDQIRSLVELGLSVELVVWKDTDRQIREKLAQPYLEKFPEQVRVINLHPSTATQAGIESQQHRVKRVTRSMLSPLASPELYYYPPEWSPLAIRSRPAELGSTVDLAIYHYSFAYGWLSREQPVREKKRAVVFLNLESDLFVEREHKSRLSLSPARLIHNLNAKKLYQHEKELARLCDELWFISPRDLETYQARFGVDHARLVAPTYSPRLTEQRCAGFKKERGRVSKVIAGFVGALDFHPNEASALWILEQVVPKLARKDFQGEIWFAGRGATPRIEAAARDYPFVKLKGFMPDLEPYWSALSFNLIPHLTGSGVRTKLLEGLASGVPTLSNREAASRVHPELRKSTLLTVEDDPARWAEILVSAEPFERRLQDAAQVRELAKALDGKSLYRFLAGR